MPSVDNHVCDVHSSADYKIVGSGTRTHNDKKYTVRYGRPKSGKGTTDVTYFYPKDNWSEKEARAHCSSHDGKFLAALHEQEGSNMPETAEVVAARAALDVALANAAEAEQGTMGSQPTVLEFSESVPVEALGYDPVRKVWPILALEAGCGKNRCYPAALVERKVKELEGLRVFDNHLKPDEEQNVNHRDPRTLMGLLENVRFDTRRLLSGRTATGAFADFHVTNPVRAVECQDSAYRQLVEFSLAAKGTKRYVNVEGQLREEVTDFEPQSVDMVFGAAQGGQFVERQQVEVQKVEQLNERMNALEGANRMLLAERTIAMGLGEVFDLPDFAKVRITESVMAAVQRDKTLDVDAALKATVLYERDYLSKAAKPAPVFGAATGGGVKRLGTHQAETRKRLRGGVRSGLGLSEPANAEGGS